MYVCTYVHVIEPTYGQFRDDNRDNMVSRCPSCCYIATITLRLCHFLILQLFTLFDGLGSVLGSTEVAVKAIAAYTQKRENVGKWFEEAVMEGNGLIEIFKKSSIDQGEPANRVKQEMDKLRKEKGRVDQLWLDAQQAKKAKLESKARRLSEENKPVVKPVSNGVVAGAPPAASAPSDQRPETEGKEASPPILTAVEPSPPEPPEQVLQVAQIRSSSVEERGKDKVKVVKAQGAVTETVSRWLTDEYAELEEEAYKVRGQVVHSGVQYHSFSELHNA